MKPAYAGRLRRVIAEADRLGMVVIVGFFYFGSNERIQITPDDRYVKEAIVQGCRFLKGLPHRNILIEINNETNASSYKHRILQPNGALDAVLLAQQTVERQIPVSMSWSGGIMPRGSRGEAAMRAVDYVMFHTNGQTPEEVHQSIQAMRRWLGYDRPVIINEDGVSTFNLHAAVQEHVGWGYYDNGLSNYRDGFQAPPVNWKINTPVKWQFFEQVARLTGSPIPPKPEYSAERRSGNRAGRAQTGAGSQRACLDRGDRQGPPPAMAHQARGILHRRRALQLSPERAIHAEQPGVVGHGGCLRRPPRPPRGRLRHAGAPLHGAMFDGRNTVQD